MIMDSENTPQKAFSLAWSMTDQNQVITTVNEICKLRMNSCKQNYANSREEFSDVVPCEMI